ncbi:SusC/RagA family TonB-linked outer membrane protein [Mucilaginibacter terrae]|uniref:TonB-linked SusC/RagA family outer membrane protein n=1 Tax=Mucilaginibacter terrae TaxID=1955052 RepID=A0ABU3GQT7_9SPHI|nr:TonB-dependent receptor [Mucilaginibacter terrae]MDT3401906.1 TonB-linked SusC/RagA family outer membrane protein [Mucilaginibacter terrae]
MKRIFTRIVFLALLFVSSWAVAQNTTITGRVTDAADKQPLPGVSVTLNGTTTGTQTDADGKFTISAPANGTLTFSYIGYANQDVAINNRTTLDVTLTTSTKAIEQVVVIGYGTQRRRDVTGAVGTISGAELTKQPVQTPTQALQGKVAGVQVIGSGQPNSQPQLRIRGTGSVLGGANPLYVVDGVLTDDIRNINNNDILSIDVLKDASAAIYGVRGANGVVIITTRKGKNGPPVIRYDANAGFRELSNKLQMANREQYISYLRDANPGDVARDQSPLTYPGTTDWYDAVLKKGLQMSHNLSLAGGNEKTTYFFSANTFTDDGLIKTNSFDRYSFRSNIDVKITDNLTFGTQLSLSRSNERPVPLDGVYSNVYRAAPIIPAIDANGRYGNTSLWGNLGNPLLSLDKTINQTVNNRVQGNVYLEYKPIKSLTFRTAFNTDAYWNKQRNYNAQFNADGNTFTTAGGSQFNNFSTLFIQNDQSFRSIWDNTVTWQQSFNKHNITVLGGYTQEYIKTDLFSGSRRNVPQDPDLWYLDVGNPEVGASYANNGALFRRLSYLGRVNYSYAGKYLFSASFRADGSSRFKEKYGYFPTVGAGWVISEEDFLKNSKVISNLKLRGSWGQLGNDNIDQGLFITTATLNLPYFFNNSLNLGSAIQDIKDPNLKWERTTQFDIGLEYGFLNNKLTGEIDYYNKKVRDALTNVTIPGILGDPDGIYVTNAASYQNTGVEFAIKWSDKIGKLNYSVGGNINYNKNKVVGLNGGQALVGGGIGNQGSITRTDNGQPIASYYVLQQTGIFQNQQQIDAAPTYNLNGYAKSVGGMMFADVSGPNGTPDGVIDNYDRVFSGSYQPKYYGGFNIGLSYESWDLSADFYGNWGNKIYNGRKAFRANGNDNVEANYVNNRWTPSNPSNVDPRVIAQNLPASTYFIESGSFLRLNNLTLGYTLPADLLKRIKINKIRVFAASQNLFTAKRYNGFTPELFTSDILASGVDLNGYPTTRTFTFGLNVEF